MLFEFYAGCYSNVIWILFCRLSEIGPDDIAKQEADAYSAYKGQGHFTANPEMSESGDKPKSRYIFIPAIQFDQINHQYCCKA